MDQVDVLRASIGQPGNRSVVGRGFISVGGGHDDNVGVRTAGRFDEAFGRAFWQVAAPGNNQRPVAGAGYDIDIVDTKARMQAGQGRTVQSQEVVFHTVDERAGQFGFVTDGGQKRLDTRIAHHADLASVDHQDRVLVDSDSNKLRIFGQGIQ